MRIPNNPDYGLDSDYEIMCVLKEIVRILSEIRLDISWLSLAICIIALCQVVQCGRGC